MPTLVKGTYHSVRSYLDSCENIYASLSMMSINICGDLGPDADAKNNNSVPKITKK